jgi:4'-phosphopantetheinyl transferase
MRAISNAFPQSTDARAIDVWLAFYDELADERVLATMGDLLSDAEREQQRRFHFADDRKRYLVTRALVRSVLSRYADVAPADWAFHENAYGRPAIAPEHREAGDLRFNISHARGLVALAVGRRHELGIDVENLVHRPVSTEIANRFFSAVEVADLAGVPPAGRQDRFFEYWTLKESYIKARALGLSLPLDKFSFLLTPQRGIRIEIDASLHDEPGRWSFFQYRPTPDHLLALCVEQRAGQSTLVTMRRMTPSADYEPFDTPLLKSSAFA